MVVDNRGRGRGNRKRNKRNNKQHQGPKKINVPLPAQTKLVWRNIHNVEKYGTVEKVLQMVQNMLAIANEKNVNQYTIDIDRGAMRYLIQEEELANKYLQEFKASQEVKKETKEEEEVKEEEKEGEQLEGGEEAVEANPVMEETKEEVPEPQPQELDVVVAPKLNSSIPLIMARPLYVIPPRKTRRHGDKVGCAYILLTAPKIEKIEVPSSMPPEIMEVEVPEEDEDKGTPAVEEATEPAPEDSNPEEGETKEGEEEAPLLAEETNEGEAPPNPEDQPSPVLDSQAAINKALAADYSTAVAKGRLLVSRAIEVLAGIASEDAKGPQEFAGCQIEAAMSGKTWRHQYRADRREGTIESTNEYKNWLQSLTKKKQELESRPKPAPGGGAANNLVGLVGESSGQDPAQGQPVAAIVQHLRAKRQELKRKKTKKKKEKTDKAGGGKNKKKDGTRGAGPAGGAKKKKKKVGAGVGGGKKKAGGGKKPNAPTMAPPTALLKAGGGGTAH